MIEDLRLLLTIYKNKGRYGEYTYLSLMRGFKSDKVSASMLSQVSGVSKHKILRVIGKTSMNGGKLNPETLEDMLELAVNGFKEETCLRVLRAGTSQGVLSHFTGINQSRLSRLWRKHESSN